MVGGGLGSDFGRGMEKGGDFDGRWEGKDFEFVFKFISISFFFSFVIITFSTRNR